MNNKVILVDCDGVLLDWIYAFGQWMNRHGFCEVDENEYCIAKRYNIEKSLAKMLIRMFNESATIRKLPPLRDAIKYVKKLHEEHGYIFHAITSLSDDYYSQHLRTKNLIELFGPTAFQKYTYLDTGADKDNELYPYRGTECYWIEDKPENAICGANFGLNSLLMTHEHNSTFEDERVKRVSNWQEIHDIIVGL